MVAREYKRACVRLGKELPDHPPERRLRALIDIKPQSGKAMKLRFPLK